MVYAHSAWAFVTLGHRDALQSWRDRDADTIEKAGEGDGLVLASTHCPLGESREVPKADTTWAEPSGMGRRRSAGMASASARRQIASSYDVSSLGAQGGWWCIHRPPMLSA